MLLVQLFATGMQLLSKFILTNGTFVFALMTYRHIVAALCVAPFAFFFEGNIINKLNWSICFWLFVNALIGITAAMGLYYYGLKDTDATYAVYLLNLIPIVTFIFSAILRIETIGLNKRAGRIKCLGAMSCVAGALTTALYRGKSFYISPHHQLVSHFTIHESGAHRLRGSLMLLGSCFSYSAWYLLQFQVIKAFPQKYWATMLTCILACLQSAVIGLCIDSRASSWMLGWNLQLVTIVYSGALATAATFCLISWAVSKRGPTYPSMFNPLAVIFVAISEALLFGTAIYAGTLVGLLLIIMGLYSFLWGKNKEMKRSQPSPPNLEAEEEGNVAPDGYQLGQEVQTPISSLKITNATSLSSPPNFTNSIYPINASTNDGVHAETTYTSN
ncbi:hypothetical protein K2173_021814 [Erythroxylum novogranatense]|uniref:WAT1-related protein n=1 Tax=Erythroxylum novogranatense TaxID=1862640 RepID=A0AAV8T1Z1_9ROSI|nr:hypothetical protein K2173_021814 [Erythroxylum novogranatense]